MEMVENRSINHHAAVYYMYLYVLHFVRDDGVRTRALRRVFRFRIHNCLCVMCMCVCMHRRGLGSGVDAIFIMDKLACKICRWCVDG